MRHRSKLCLAALTAALCLGVMVDSSSARRLEVSTQRIRTITPEFSAIGGEIRITCSITTEGSFHSRTISKVSGALVGYITRISIAHPCRGGEIRALTETLPWHIEYLSFTGTLPRITSMRGALVGLNIQQEAIGITCLYRTTQEHPGIGISEINAEGQVTGGRSEEATQIPHFSGSMLCPREGHTSGTGTVADQETGRPIFVRLVL
jgi:hypothetical protein